mgnify:CR=1 FL=1
MIPSEWNEMTTAEIRAKHPLFLTRLLSTNASFRIVWRNKRYYECQVKCEYGRKDRKSCENCRNEFSLQCPVDGRKEREKRW